MINGWYGHGNAGDDAILQIFIDQALSRLDCDIVVLSEKPDNIAPGERVTSMLHPYLRSLGDAFVALFNGRIWRHAMLMRECDLFVLGGGGLLRDNTSWRNLIRLLDEIWLCKLTGRRAMLYAIGVGPFKTRIGSYLIGKTARMCDLITVRSEGNAALLRSVGVPAERIHVVADPAFLLEPEVPDDPALVAMLAGRARVGVFPTISLLGGRNDHSHIKRIAAALDQLAERDGLLFAAFAMRYAPEEVDDVAMSRAIRAAMRNPDALAVYDKPLTPAQMKWVTSQMLLNITVRLHAMIFSAGANVPAVAINYEPKVANVFATFKSPQFLVEMDRNLEVALYAAVRRCLAELEPYTQRIRDAEPLNRSSAELTFELMEQLCQGKPVNTARVSSVQAESQPGPSTPTP